MAVKKKATPPPANPLAQGKPGPNAPQITPAPAGMVGPTPTPAAQPTGPAKKSSVSSTKGTGATGTKVTQPTGPAPTGASTESPDFYTKYGIQAALIDSDPSLQKLFQNAMAGGWDKSRFQAEFLNTPWAKQHSATWQNAETARLSAPGDYANSYNRMREYLARLAVSMGETIDPGQLGVEQKADANGNYSTVQSNPNDIVQWALAQSWGKGVDEAAIRQHLAQVGKLNTAIPGGEAANYEMQLKSLANDYGLNSLNTPTSGQGNYFTDAAQSILLGKSTMDTWKQDIINQAKNTYKPYAAQLDAGISLRSIAAPYINTLSNLLELPSDSIDLSSPTGYGKMVSNALMGTDPTNPQPMTLLDFEKQVKQDPRWATTTNARDTVMGGVGNLLRLFGKVS